MIAIISCIMLGFGFINGMIVATLLDKYNVVRAKHMLENVLDQKFELEKKVDDLEEKIVRQEEEKDEILTRLNNVVRPYIRLPPPSSPLVRCVGYGEKCSDSEHGVSYHPGSPEPDEYNKG